MNKQVRREMGERIRALRISLGLNQEEFGALFGKQHQAISKWEMGVTVPPLEDWYKLGRMSGSLDFLVYGLRTRPIVVSPMVEQIFGRPGVELPPSSSGTLARQPES